MGILSDIHQDLKGKYKTVMDGCYLLKGKIGKRQTETKKCLSVNFGKVAWESDVINPITWRILGNKGISIMGPEIISLDFEVDEGDLINYVLYNMNTYWLNRMNRNKRFKGVALFLPNGVPPAKRRFTTLKKIPNKKSNFSTFKLKNRTFLYLM